MSATRHVRQCAIGLGIPPWILRSVLAAGRLLPFCLSGQALLSPLAVRLCLRPGNTSRGIIGQFAIPRARWNVARTRDHTRCVLILSHLGAVDLKGTDRDLMLRQFVIDTLIAG